jgi:hypothetical protein
MPSIEFPTHIHFHPHHNVADYAEVAELAHRVEDPFLVFLPEAPSGESIHDLQLISNGNKALHRQYQRWDKKNRHNGVSLDQNFARTRALSEIVFNTGLVVVSVHPAWDEQAMLDNATALGKDRTLKPTLGEAVEALAVELPEITKVIKKRDTYTAINFSRMLQNVYQTCGDLRSLDYIPCLMEVGSLHFQVAQKLVEKGVTVTTSGHDDPSKLEGAFEQGIGQLLVGTSDVTRLDLELIAFEDALSNIIRADTSHTKKQAISTIVTSLDRKEWADEYKRIART